MPHRGFSISIALLVLLSAGWTSGCQKGRQQPEKPGPARRIKLDTSLKGLVKALRHPTRWVRAKAIMTLPKYGNAALLPLAKALDQLEPALQMGAMAGMESIGVAAIPHFLPLLQHKSRAVRMQAARSLAALFSRYNGPTAESNGYTRLLVQSVLQLREASVWRDLRKILCQRQRQAARHIVKAIQRKLSTNRAPTKANHQRPAHAWMQYAAGGTPPPLSRLVALLQCHHPLTAPIYRSLTPLVPLTPPSVQLQLMGLFAMADGTQLPVVNDAWNTWLHSKNDHIVVATLNRMTRLKIKPTARLTQRLRQLLTAGTPGHQWRAARLLGQWTDNTGSHLSALALALKSDQPRLRHVAAVALARQNIPLTTLLQRLKDILNDRSDIAQAGALLALGEAASRSPIGRRAPVQTGARQPTTQPSAKRPTSQPASQPTTQPNVRLADPVGFVLKRLKLALHAHSPHLREAATTALGQWAQRGDQQASSLLLVALVDHNEDVRVAAVKALSTLKQHIRVGVLGLTQALRDSSPLIRKHAARGLGQLGLQGAPALQALRSAARKETDYLAKQTMIQASRRILRALRKQGPR